LVFVADAGRQSVVVFDLSGAFLFEMSETSDGRPNWTLPTGLLTLDSADLATVFRVDQSMPENWLLVSDPFNARSLTLLGLFIGETELHSNAR
jgi:hypothetical protein